MKMQNKLSTVLAAALAFAISSSLLAQDATKATTTMEADMTNAEVRKVDKDAKKITLKHEAIKNLDMPGMTMVFQVKDATLLDKTKAGDKVKFKAVQEGSAYVVTEIKVNE